MHLGEDLKGILSEAPGKCVPYAVIEGAFALWCGWQQLPPNSSR